MKDILEQIGKIKIIPVIKIDNANDAVPLAAALGAGGIPCAEITFRTSAAEDAIRRISNELPDVLTGAGTVLSVEQADKAIEAGAQFLVSPGFNPRVVSHCISRGILIIPGCITPSEMEQAMEMGISTVKFFPAEQSGGLEYIKAVSAPYPDLRFIPTGGINSKNISTYLSFNKVLACGGSWMAAADLINKGDFGTIEALSKESAAIIRNLGACCIGNAL